MTDEELAKEYTDEYGFGSDCNNLTSYDANKEIEQAYLAGLEAGRPKWHDLRKNSEDLPKTSGKYLVYTGGEPFFLYFDTEVNSFGYWVASVGDDWGIQDEYFETVKESGEDEVIEWCEIPKFEEVDNA